MYVTVAHLRRIYPIVHFLLVQNMSPDHQNIAERQRHQLHPITWEGMPFKDQTLSSSLVETTSSVPSEFLNPWKSTLVCVDEGILSLYGSQRLVPISGSGVGVPTELLKRAVGSVRKAKPHRGCAAVYGAYSESLAKEGLPSPTQEEADEFAVQEAQRIGRALGVDCGRILDFDPSRQTHLARPKHIHPADGAIISLDNLFLHNLLGPEGEREKPPQFRLAGDYYRHMTSMDDPLLTFAQREAMLALKIASGDHGIGIVERGFRYTVLVDANDPDKDKVVQLAQTVHQMALL